MKKLFVWIVLGMLGGVAGAGSLRADDTLRHVQESLRDQGFYYGPIDGATGDETVQAIRRYQIRNGLPVTGQLDEETKRSIDKTGAAAVPATSGSSSGKTGRQSTLGPVPTPARTAPTQRVAPQDDAGSPAASPAYQRPTVRPVPNDEDRDENRDDGGAPEGRGPQGDRPDLRTSPEAPPRYSNAPLPRNAVLPSARLSEVFASTPYEFAPPPVQADVLRRAQAFLTRQGFYDGPVNGVPSELTADALVNFQGVNRLRKTGRLDVGTLGVLRLLPGRQRLAPGGGDEDGPRRDPNIIFEGRIAH